MDKPERGFFFLLFLTFSSIIQTVSSAKDRISTTEIIRDGETMVSSDGMFEVGFFSPGNSKNRYVGMWFKNLPVQTVVWVANREVPITNTSGVVLKVIEPGLLVLLNEGTNGTIIWSSNKSSKSVQNPVAQLLPLGNLVVRDANDENRPENFIWQSFDYPTDTFLPGMKYGWNLVTGFESYFMSWRSEDDPGSGEFTVHLDLTGYPQLLLKKGSALVQRSGPWNGLGFSGLAYARNDPAYRMRLVMNENEITVSRYFIDRSVISRTRLNPIGVAQRWTWVNRTQEWVVFHNMPADNCDSYKLCGVHGICNVENSPSCGCLDRFVPKDQEGWSKGDWSHGCVRRTNLSCGGDVFLKYSGIKMPDSRNSSFTRSMSLDECRVECSRNCTCTAYTQLDISDGGTGCLHYFGELVDIRKLYQDGQDLYIRMASSESGDADSKGRKGSVIIMASVTTIVGVILFGLSLTFCVLRRKKLPKMMGKGSYRINHAKDSELSLFKLSVILKATDNFSIYNKLGEGGFGPVYKGVLEEGQEIAVKSLSKTSLQGLDEFKNEVITIAKLQHRNLVRLLGCCIKGEENMLIYEYLPNKSLDLILFGKQYSDSSTQERILAKIFFQKFDAIKQPKNSDLKRKKLADQTKRELLDWQKRFHIINGIARGLLYLHQDSRLRIIHRDLKTSNILLDSDMNPKISDFGMARSFRGNEIEDKTERVAGTYGYMSPEYTMHGLFSLKSDVFSFGVILLEIVSGKRNRGYSDDEHNFNLLGYAWTLYREERTRALVDASLGDSFNLFEVLRSIHVGLLCVQRDPEDRPSMSTVVFMLRNEVVLPEVKHPGFFMERDDFVGRILSEKAYPVNSVNEVSITLPNGR